MSSVSCAGCRISPAARAAVLAMLREAGTGG